MGEIYGRMMGSVSYGLELYLACMCFLLPLKKKENFILRAGTSGLALILLAAGVYYAGSAGVFAHIKPEILLFAAAYFGSVALFFVCSEGKGSEPWYCGVWAVVDFLLLYELGELFCAAVHAGEFTWRAAACGLLVSVAGNTAVGLTAARWMPEKGRYRIGPRQLFSAWALCVISGSLYAFACQEKEYIVIGLILQFYSATLLYLQNALFRKSSMKKELDLIQILWHQRKGQYQLSKETVELINRKCHDLKHQIRAMRFIDNEEERNRYIGEVEESVRIYSAIVRTGNEILDTILTEKSLVCESKGIGINCVANGELLSFMDPVDLYTLFGNGLDNAVEAVRMIGAQEKRVIDIMVYEKQGFLMIQIVNPVLQKVRFEEGLPVTTKAKNGYHGYGVKSMRQTAEKYGGHLVAEIKSGCFYIKVMIPMQKGRATS